MSLLPGGFPGRCASAGLSTARAAIAPGAFISGVPFAITSLDQTVQKTVDVFSNCPPLAIAAAALRRWIEGAAGARHECRVAHQGTPPQACLMQPALERRLADAGDLGRLARGESLDVTKHERRAARHRELVDCYPQRLAQLLPLGLAGRSVP